MNESARKNGDVIRRVSKATALLQAFAAMLLIGLIYLLSGIYGRYEALQDGVRENALWSVYQLDREARTLREVTNVMVARADLSASAFKSLSTRYDILYSRMSILKRANFDLRLQDNPELRMLVATIEPMVLMQAAWFDELAKGHEADLSHLSAFAGGLDDLVGKTESLLTSANNKVSTDRADARNDLESLQIRTGLVTVLLAGSIGVLVFSLRRQLRSVRAAALAFEGMARELTDAYAAAEAGNRAKSQFMATMGHEVRTPLNAILGTAELLELGALPEAVRGSVQTIRRSGVTLLEILNEILDFAKMETGRIDVSPAPTDVRELLSSAIEMMRDRAAEHGDTIVTDISGAGPAKLILTDATRVRQIVLNLLSNAIKFTSNGAVVVKMSGVEDDQGNARLRISISDTGIGIDEIGQKKLFKPFSQVDASISRKYGGTGLGLTICKEIVDALDGEIGMHSRKDEGSTFWFEIPALAVEAPPAAAKTEEVVGDLSEKRPSFRVLLVEDNLVNQQVACGFLRHLGQSVVVANDGREALQKVHDENFDLILMDMQMPNMDGIEATRQIRSLGGTSSTVPIVAMTANASDEDRKLCAGAGMTDFRPKPITLEVLRSIINALEAKAPCISAASSVNDRQQEIIDVLGRDVFDDLLDTFFSDAAAILSDIADNMRGGRPESIDRQLHSLKGAASNVGMQTIADMAQRLRQDTVITSSELLDIKRAVDEQRRMHAA